MSAVSVVFNSMAETFLREQLFPADGSEAGAVILLGINDVTNGPHGLERRYLTHSVCRIPAADIVTASSRHFSWRKATFLRLLKQAQSEQLAIAFVHSHRGAEAYFSKQDDRNDREVAELVANRTSRTVDYVSIVIDERGRLVARKVEHNEPPIIARVCAVFGRQWEWHFSANRFIDSTAYDRQVLAFGPEFLETLTRIRIGVIGAGATGSATAILLARNGAADIIVIDPDVVDYTNLSRLHGATVRDADEARPKVQVLGRHIREFGLGTTVAGFQTWVGDPSVREVLKSCDLVFGCTDDHAGRLLINRFSYFYNVPLVDMGISIDPKRLREGHIASADARVTVVGPGLPCLICRRIVDPVRAREEHLARDDPQQFQRQVAEGYVTGANVPNPAVIALTTDVACLAVDELTARLTGYRRTSNNRVRKHRLLRDTFPGAAKERDCAVCGSPTNWGRGDVEPFLDRIG